MDNIIYKVLLENNRISDEISEILKTKSTEDFFAKMESVNKKLEAVADNYERLALLTENRKEC